MTETFVVRETTACGCTPDSRSLVGSYIDGPIVSALLDLRPYRMFNTWRTRVTSSRGGGWGYQLSRSKKANLTVDRFEKSNYLEDWVAIDHSKPVRQGRQMGAGYRATLEERGGPPTEWRELTPLKCPLHYRLCLGVFAPAAPRVIAGRVVDRRLVAYMSAIRTDNLLIASQLLAHKEYMNLGAMPTLWMALVAMLTADPDKCPAHAVGVEAILYAGWGDGTPGLRAWKQNAGFEPRRMVSAVAAQGGTK